MYPTYLLQTVDQLEDSSSQDSKFIIEMRQK